MMYMYYCMILFQRNYNIIYFLLFFFYLLIQIIWENEQTDVRDVAAWARLIIHDDIVNVNITMTIVALHYITGRTSNRRRGKVRFYP